MFPADHQIIERGARGRRVMWCVASRSHLSRFWTAMGRRPHQTFPSNIKNVVQFSQYVYIYINHSYPVDLKGAGTHSDHQYNESDNTWLWLLDLRKHNLTSGAQTPKKIQLETSRATCCFRNNDLFNHHSLQFLSLSVHCILKKKKKKWLWLTKTIAQLDYWDTVEELSKVEK